MSETPRVPYDKLQETTDSVRENATPKLIELFNSMGLLIKDLGLTISKDPKLEDYYISLLKEVIEMAQWNPESIAIAEKKIKLSPEGKALVKEGKKLIREGQGKVEKGITLISEDYIQQTKDAVDEAIRIEDHNRYTD